MIATINGKRYDTAELERLVKSTKGSAENIPRCEELE